ncbi:acyltransferase [Bermanella sp. R86510]|uniref:acyltransferase n=1 Tax=unclassified Bermanella TaxID=2627862 RepID=UPI0037C61388
MFALFKALYFVGFIILFSLIAALIGVSALPGYYLIELLWQNQYAFSNLMIASFALIITYTLIPFVAAIFIRLLALISPITEGKSSIYGSKMAVWAVQYLLMNFLNTVFLPVFRTTPLMNLFYRIMGAKIGNNVFFNSSFIYEPHLLEIGDNSRVGENAIIVPHTTEGKNFTCKKVKIGKNVTIGQYCQILPGAIIGDNVIIGAGAIVPKDKVIESNTIYGGNPLQFIKQYQ